MKTTALLLALFCVLCGHSSFAAARPAIIVFLSGDHGMLDSAPYGSADVRTPNMRRLADPRVSSHTRRAIVKKCLHFPQTC